MTHVDVTYSHDLMTGCHVLHIHWPGVNEVLVYVQYEKFGRWFGP